MIEPRVYRAAFVPALFALVLAMFSLQSQPRPLPQGLAADVLFDGRLAAQSAAAIVERNPDRRAGSIGDLENARRVAETLERRGFRVQQERFEHAGEELVNVVGRRAGRLRRQLVIVAARDASGVPDADGSASDTAALLELARILEGRPSRKTLVLASVDGSSLGEVGTRRLAESLGDPDLVDAVLVVSDLGASERHGSLLVAWSNDSQRAGIGFQRTVADSIRQELEEAVGGTSAAGQLARVAFPVGVGAQGVFLERGFEAVRISGSGELPPEGPSGVEAVNRDRLGGLGRATLRSVTALDQRRPPERGPRTYVIAVSQVMPGWVLALLGLALLAPAAVASVDAFARARRRREPVARWFRWLAVWTAPLVAALALAELFALAGATPDPPPAPAPPEDFPLDGPAVAVLAGLAGIACLLFAAGRFLFVRADPALLRPTAPGAACATALVLSACLLLLWAVNPFALLLLVPAAHLWILATLPDPRPPRRARLLLLACGALPPLLVALYYLVELSLDPLSGAWYLLLLVTGHAVGLASALIACVLLGTLAAVAAMAAARDPERPQARAEGPRVYGPGAYAGPGSLGGTESALRR